MDPIEGSETSANINQTLGIHPKIETVNTEHSESLKSINKEEVIIICAVVGLHLFNTLMHGMENEVKII
jgi:hypothetical protein